MGLLSSIVFSALLASNPPDMCERMSLIFQGIAMDRDHGVSMSREEFLISKALLDKGLSYQIIEIDRMMVRMTYGQLRNLSPDQIYDQSLSKCLRQ